MIVAYTTVDKGESLDGDGRGKREEKPYSAFGTVDDNCGLHEYFLKSLRGSQDS